jgi:uncharacterized protein (DUF3084 family)
MQELEARSSEIFQRNRELQNSNNLMRSEISELKNKLQIYATQCNCNIRGFFTGSK